MQGIVVVNKPKGWSSFDVVKKIKRIFNTSKVGHLGTLDPMAEGVLPVAIGRATKLFDFYLTKTKTYIAEFEFGYETNTLDAEGEIITRTSKIPTKNEVEEILKSFIGKIMQTPPKFSAVKINGKRAYLLARENIDFVIKPKEIEIFNLELVEQINKTTYKILIDCGAGTYIRSLGRDIAYKLDSLATMTRLTRIKSGNFTLEQAQDLNIIENEPLKYLISTTKSLESLPKIQLEAKYLSKLLNGVEIKLKRRKSELISIYVEEKLFGIGQINNSILKIHTRLYEGEN